MNLAELDQAAADLVRAYTEAENAGTETPECAIVIRTNKSGMNVRVICLSIDKSLLATYLNKAAEVIFDGQGVQSRSVQ